MLNKKDIEEINKDIGLHHTDRYKAKFYLHEVLDSEASYGDSREKAILEAEAKTKRTGVEADPDFSDVNLIKLGAKAVYKKIPYVEIMRYGAKDSKSYPATDIYKQQFADEWAEFEEKHANIREERDNLRTETSRSENSTAGSNWQGQGVAYNPTPYTITFG